MADVKPDDPPGVPIGHPGIEADARVDYRCPVCEVSGRYRRGMAPTKLRCWTAGCPVKVFSVLRGDGT